MTPMQPVLYEENVNKSFTHFRKRSLAQETSAQDAWSGWMHIIKNRR